MNILSRSKFNSITTVILLTFIAGFARAQNDLKDAVVFGNSKSEKEHQFTGDDSKAIKGGLAQTARVMLPLSTPGFEGGRLAFQMKADPDKQNYFTVKLWGSDKDKATIMLFVDGKQVGYHHIGDIDYVFLGNGDPFFRDRFTYVTIPIPMLATKGKSTLNLELRSYGEIWPYGMTFETFQKKMDAPTLGIYQAYTHTTAYFEPPTGEVEGKAITNPPVRTKPGEEVITAVKERVNKELKRVINSPKPPNQQEIMFLAPAYQVEWTAAYHNKAVVDKVIEGMDNHYRIYLDNPSIIYTDKNIYKAIG